MVRVENLTVRAGEFQITDVNFEIPEGKYGVLMGKTGSGKTTVLEAICGLKNVVGGKIFVSDVDVTDELPGRRGIGFVPQDGSLFSTKTVRKHLAFGPKVHGWKAERISKRIDELAAALDIVDILDRKPHGLSGGERQRVSLGRALAVKPSVLCLDEPLSALDEDTHAEMVALLKRVTAELGVTALHITHSSREAQLVGDLHFRIEDGKIVSA